MSIRKHIDIIQALNEKLSFSQVRPYMKAAKKYNKAEYDAMFTRFAKYGRGKSNPQRLYFPLKPKGEEDLPQDSNSVQNQVYKLLRGVRRRWLDQSDYTEAATSFFALPAISGLIKRLGATDWTASKSLYKKGLLQVGKNQIKIGKTIQDLQAAIQLLEKLNKECVEKGLTLSRHYHSITLNELLASYKSDIAEVLKLFQNDPVRAASKALSYYVVISRHPYDIAGMSTDRGWTSCTNLLSGGQRVYVKAYVVNGNLIAYLIKEGDWNIQSPTSRQLICRYNDESNSDNYIFWPQESAYGARSPGFDRFVQMFCKIINRGKDDGVYETKDDQQYLNTVRKTGNEHEKSDYDRNNNRHNPDDPDDEDYEPDDPYNGGYDEDDENDDNDLEERRQALSVMYRRSGATYAIIDEMESIYGDGDDRFPMFDVTEDRFAVIVDTHRNLGGYADNIDDGLVAGLYRLYQGASDDDELESLPVANITDDHLQTAIDRLPTDSYNKLMNHLGLRAAPHNNPHYHTNLRRAVAAFKRSDLYHGINTNASIVATPEFREFIGNRLEEYVEYNWRLENPGLNAFMPDGIDGEVETHLEMRAAIDCIASDMVYTTARELTDLDFNAMEERENAMPESVYARLPKKESSASLFSDDDNESQDGFMLGPCSIEASAADDPAIQAYMRNATVDSAVLVKELVKAIDQL